MSGKNSDVLVLGNKKPVIVNGLSKALKLHFLVDAADKDAFLRSVADKVRGIAVTYTSEKINVELMEKLPELEIVSTFGVGYDHIDVKHAAARGITVTNTPEVLNEEVADTALGLLLNTVIGFSRADRELHRGQWPEEDTCSVTLRDRTIGMVGLGRIGQAIAKRLVAFGLPVVYYSRTPKRDVPYKYYADLIAMARDVNTLMLIVPGGPGTKNLINKHVLEALGPNGILINMARGSVVDEPALTRALKDKTILAAGLDVFMNEPHVPPELMAMENVVLLPHLGSASVYTRTAMDQLVVDNLLAWASGKPPLTPVPETPWPPSR
jgi:lactate dehydrogenase-like 2-hydroxyacid dehydrogenase